MNKSQMKFAMAAHATWLVLRNPVLTAIYTDKWSRDADRRNKYGKELTLFGFVFNQMYGAA